LLTNKERWREGEIFYVGGGGGKWVKEKFGIAGQTFLHICCCIINETGLFF
jgi:hypothetical protein